MPLHRVAVDDAEGTRLYVAERSGEVVMKTTAQRPPLGLSRRRLALDLLHAVPPPVGPVEPGDRLGVDCRHRDGAGRIRVGTLAVLAAPAIPAQAAVLSIALRRPDALASLRRPHLRHHHHHLGVQRVAVDGSVGLEPEHRADAGAARSGVARPAASAGGAAGARFRRDSPPSALRRPRRSRSSAFAGITTCAPAPAWWRLMRRQQGPDEMFHADAMLGAAREAMPGVADRRRVLDDGVRRLLLQPQPAS